MKAFVTRASWAAVMLAAGFAGSSAAQDPSYARNLSAACFTCHGTDGRSVGGVPPALAGRDRGELLEIMKGFKSGTRPASLMHQQAKGYTDPQIEAIAGYFAGTTKGPAAPAPAAQVNY